MTNLISGKKMYLVKSIIKNSSWSYYVLILNIFTGILHTGFLTRALGVIDFGKYHALLAFGAIVMGVFSFLGSEALIPYATKYKKNGDNKNLLRTIKGTISLIYLSTVIGFIFFLVVLYIKPQWAGLTENEIILGVLVGFTSITGANIYSYMNILRVFENYSIYLKQALIFDSFKVMIAVTLYYFNFGLIYYVTALLIRQVLQTLYYDYYTRKTIGEYLGNHLSNLFTKQLSFNSEEKRFFTFNFFSANLRTISLQLDKVLISILLNSTSAVGLYVAAKRIMEMTELAFSNLSTAIIPQLASDFYSDKKKLTKNIIIQTGLIMILGIPVIGFVLLFTENIIVLWMGNEFLAAVPIARIVLIAVLFKVFFFVLSYMPSAVGDAKAKLLGLSFGLVCSLTIIFSTYEALGIMSFAFSVLGSVVSFSIFMGMYSIKMLKTEN